MENGVIVYPSARESGNKKAHKPMKLVKNSGENRRIRLETKRGNSSKNFEKSS